LNLLLIEPHERQGPGLARVEGRKARHLSRVLGKEVGGVVRVGELGGCLGSATLERVEEDVVWLRYGALDESPPLASPVSVVLALPRPPMLRRILQALTSLGVKRVVLLHTARVEKSFWSSHALTEAAIAEQLRLGLEQARDTIVPTVELRRRFLPFVEDELASFAGQGRRLLAEPLPDAPAPTTSVEPTTIAVGPEGGWVPFELDRLCEQGLSAVSLGPRILRVETAVVALVARLGAP